MINFIECTINECQFAWIVTGEKIHFAGNDVSGRKYTRSVVEEILRLNLFIEATE